MAAGEAPHRGERRYSSMKILKSLAALVVFAFAIHAQEPVCGGPGSNCFCVGCNDYSFNTLSGTKTLSYGSRLVYGLSGFDRGAVYLVELSFQDPTSIKSGDRVMSVKVNDGTWLESFDVWASGGRATTGAIKRSILVPAIDGQIILELTAGAGQTAILSGITVSRPFLPGIL